MSKMVNSCHLLLLSCFIFFIKTSSAQAACNPSACGNIHNISYPFRLKDDPKECGYNSSDIVIFCENNTTASVNILSYKYNVVSINYDSYTIQLVDPSIKANDICSFPANTPNWSYLTRNDGPYSLVYNGSKQRSFAILNCSFPLNSSLLIHRDECDSNSTNRRYTYIDFGQLTFEEVKDTCRVDNAALTSFPLTDKLQRKKINLSDVHTSLLYGFELSWSKVYCKSRCNQFQYCQVDEKGKPVCKPGNCYHSFQSLETMTEMKIMNVTVYPFGKGGFPETELVGLCQKPWDFYVKAGILVIMEICIGLFVPSRILIGIPFVIGILTYKFRTRHLSTFDGIETFLQKENSSLVPVRYSYSDIKKITKGFQEKLGQGGYGFVYKGKLRSGRIAAVKLLNNSSSNGQDFVNEVATIGRIHHVNVVKLVGYCVERTKRALVYDFMPNGSLDKYIFNEDEGSDLLSLDKKYEIAIGVARGIEYLHRGCNIQILHFDIKPHNILLDENFIPKISDFGLAQFYSTDKNVVTLTAAKGTIGYVAPELINRNIGGVSYKVDVYSFGMMLMEMLRLNTNGESNDNKSSTYFPDWIYDRLNEDKNIEIGKFDENGRRMIIVALWCILMNPNDRPTMSKVLEMLENEDEVPHLPLLLFSDDITTLTRSNDHISIE